MLLSYLCFTCEYGVSGGVHHGLGICIDGSSCGCRIGGLLGEILGCAIGVGLRLFCGRCICIG